MHYKKLLIKWNIIVYHIQNVPSFKDRTMLIRSVNKNKKKLLYKHRCIAPIFHIIIFLIFIYRTYEYLALRYYVHKPILLYLSYLNIARTLSRTLFQVCKCI